MKAFILLPLTILYVIGITPSYAGAPGQICKPGSSFKSKCNDCKCSLDGLSAACTKKACIEWGEGKQYRCEPGKTFKRECNTCTCSKDGKSAICTLIACGNNEPETTTKKQICEPGRPFKIKCNSCICSEDGTVAGCTKMACPDFPEQGETTTTEVSTSTESSFRCEPGKVFKDDCNTCTCSKDGRSAACTLMACPPIVKPWRTTTEKDEEEVEPEASYGDEEDNEDEFRCEPNTTFKQDCNTCLCGNDGKVAACTLMACNVPTRPRRDTRPRVCEPNSTFYIECNRCRCSKDGKSMGCTEKLCLKPTD